MPESILGPSGYFPLRQTNIESLRLVTDGSCPQTNDADIELALSSFPSLKRLSWIGLSSYHEIKALAAVLERTSHQLVELDLDLIYHRDLQESGEVVEDNALFAKEILGVPEKRIRKFTALRVLSLSAVSFVSTGVKASDSSDSLDSSDYTVFYSRMMQAAEEISSVFDFSAIRSLKLRFCPGWEELLELLTESPLPIRLTSLEIQSTISDECREAHVIMPFLESFEGLETLFLYTSSTSDTLDIWQSALRHKATLRRFVHHQRSINTDEEAPLFEQDCDVTDLSLFSEDVADFCTDPSQNPLSGLELSSVGLCCIPDLMVGRRESIEVTQLTRLTTLEAHCLCLCE